LEPADERKDPVNVIDIDTLRGLDAYRSAKETLTARLAELDEQAAGQPFNDEQRAEFEEISGDQGLLARVNATIDELEIRDATVRKVLDAGGRGAESPSAGAISGFSVKKVPDDIFDLAAYRQRARSLDDLPAAYQEGAKRVIEQAMFPTTERAKAQEHISRLVAKLDKDGKVSRRIIHTGSPLYQAAHAQYSANGWTGLSPAMQAALQTYTDADGGVAIPFTIDPTFILTSDGAINPWRQFARVETITTKSWRPVTTGGMTAAYAATEVTATADGAPTDFDDPEIVPVRATAFAAYTAEYAEDYGVAAIQSEIGRMVQDAKDVLEATKFAAGTGSAEPLGIIHAIVDDTNAVKTTAAADTFALDDIDALIAFVPPRFRSRGKFVGNLLVYQVARGFGDAGQPAGSIYDQTNHNLRGYPGLESSVMDSDVKTTGKNILLFGDGQQFIIVDRLGLSTEYIPQVFDGDGKPLGQRGIYCRWRNSSKVAVFNAFGLLQVA
jgi:HK97 family phage major capsid protein